MPAHSPLLLGRSSLPFASLQTLKTLRWGIRLPGFKHLKVLKPSRSIQIPRGSFHQALWPSAFAVPGLQPALCLHIAPLLLGRSSLPFASLQTLKTLRWGMRLPGFKHLKLLKPSRSIQIPRGSFHQALWPSAFAVPGLQPALCLHIVLCC